MWGLASLLQHRNMQILQVVQIRNKHNFQIKCIAREQCITNCLNRCTRGEYAATTEFLFRFICKRCGDGLVSDGRTKTVSTFPKQRKIVAFLRSNFCWSILDDSDGYNGLLVSALIRSR